MAAHLVTDLTANLARECFDQSWISNSPSASYPYYKWISNHLILQDWLEFQEPMTYQQANNRILIELQRCLKREDNNLEMYVFPASKELKENDYYIPRCL